MNLIWKLIMMLVMFFLIGVRVDGTKPDPLPSVTAGPATAMPEVTTPTETAPAEMPAVNSFHPFVVDGVLLGGSDGSTWLSAASFAQMLAGGEQYSVYDRDGYAGEGVGSAVVPEEEWNGPYTEFVEVEHALPPEAPYIAVSGDWNAMPRAPELQMQQEAMYIDIVAAALAAEGLTNADIMIYQNYRIDFEGDGEDEIVLYAENVRAEGEWAFAEEQGCFSILILIKTVNGAPQNFVLRRDVHLQSSSIDGSGYRQLREIYPILGFADLNGDGKMELITGAHYYEGYGYEVFEIFDFGAMPVLWNGFGA